MTCAVADIALESGRRGCRPPSIARRRMAARTRPLSWHQPSLENRTSKSSGECVFQAIGEPMSVRFRRSPRCRSGRNRIAIGAAHAVASEAHTTAATLPPAARSTVRCEPLPAAIRRWPRASSPGASSVARERATVEDWRASHPASVRHREVPLGALLLFDRIALSSSGRFARSRAACRRVSLDPRTTLCAYRLAIKHFFCPQPVDNLRKHCRRVGLRRERVFFARASRR